MRLSVLAQTHAWYIFMGALTHGYHTEIKSWCWRLDWTTFGVLFAGTSGVRTWRWVGCWVLFKKHIWRSGALISTWIDAPDQLFTRTMSHWWHAHNSFNLILSYSCHRYYAHAGRLRMVTTCTCSTKTILDRCFNSTTWQPLTSPLLCWIWWDNKMLDVWSNLYVGVKHSTSWWEI